MIKLGFFGAAGEVTGSCYVVTTDRARVMIDMGMHLIGNGVLSNPFDGVYRPFCEKSFALIPPRRPSRL